MSELLVEGGHVGTKFRFPHEVEGYLSESEGRLLFRSACQAPAGTKIIELGAYKGRSTICLGQSGRDVATFDHFEGEQFEGVPAEGGIVWPDHLKGSYMAALLENLERYGLRDKVRVWASDTVAGAKHVKDGSVGFIFIDSDHSYEHVSAEWAAWEPKLAPGATVAFDDIGFDGPKKLIKETVLTSGWKLATIVGKVGVFVRDDGEQRAS